MQPDGGWHRGQQEDRRFGVEGRVVRGVGGFFDVQSGNEIVRCRARGVFRKRGTTVVVGDWVNWEPASEDEAQSGEAVITGVYPRSTELVRPPMANCDTAVLVFSVRTPDFQGQLLDRTLVSVTNAGLFAVIVLSKIDLLPLEEVQQLAEPYERAGYQVLKVGRGYDGEVARLKEALAGHVSVFAGPSGAGKSSLANLLAPELGLKMGSISEKAGRGRHTTRHVELFPLGPSTFVADAPGFSKLDVDVDSAELRHYFPEFAELAENCPYRGCQHVHESTCAVKDAVETGQLSASRYESYRALYEELRIKEERRY